MPGSVNVAIRWIRAGGSATISCAIGNASAAGPQATVNGAGAGPTLISPVSVGVYSGTATSVGSTLIPNPAVWQNEYVAGQYPVQRSWQWYRNGSPISNAVSGTYTTVQADSGSSISVQETAFFLNPSNNGITYEAPHDTSVSTSAAVSVTGSVDSNLVFSNNIQYLGSFQIQSGIFNDSLGKGKVLALNPSASSGSGRSFLCSAFNGNPNTNPLKNAEIQIQSTLGNAYTTSKTSLPYSSMSLPTSGAFNDFYDIYNGQLRNSGIGNSDYLAGSTQAIYLTGTTKMVMGASVSYPPDRPYSLWWKRDAQLSSNTIDGIFTIKDPAVAAAYSNYDSRWTVGYVFPIPPEHQAALGNKQYIGGAFSMSIIQTQSDGPSGCAFSNADIDDAISKYTSGTAQGAGAGSNTIVISASDTRADGFYNGMLIYVPSASTPNGFVKKITGYVSATKTVTVDSNWDTAPTSSSTYKIYPNANGKQLFGYFENEMQALSTDGAASQVREINTVRKWDGSSMGGIFPNGTKSILMFAYNGDGYSTYGVAGQYDGGGPPSSGARIYSPRADIQNAPHAYPYYAKVYAYNVDDLAAVQSGTKVFNQVKPYGVWDFPIPYTDSPTGQFDLVVSFVVYDPSTARMYLTASDAVHVYSITNAVVV
jgi:hypothetical protein